MDASAGPVTPPGVNRLASGAAFGQRLNMMDRWTRRHFMAASLAWMGGARGETPAADPFFLKPGDAAYEAARQPFNAVVKSRPALIAACRTEADVVAAVRHAREAGLPIAVKSGGHAFHGYSLNEGGMVIEVSGMRVRALQEGGERFTAGPGFKLREVYSWLAEHGRMLPAGSCGGVGLSGLTLGGGYGLFAREFGLTCDHLEQVRLVDGEGRVRDSREDADLLWACRGGGNGNFGVVTAMSFRTQVAPSFLSSCRFRARNLGTAAMVRVIRSYFDATAALAEPMFAALVLNGSQATVLLTSTRPRAGPAFKAFSQAMQSAGLTTKGALERPLLKALESYEGRPGPLPFDNVSAGFYRGFSDLEAIAAGISETVIRTGGLVFQINTLGGAIARGPDGAYPHREMPYLGELQAYWEKGDIPAPLAAGHARIRRLLREAGITRHYRNYPDPRLEGWEQAYFGDRYGRLQEIKARLDPADRFQHPQSVRRPGQ